MKNILMILTNGFNPDVRVYKEAKYLQSNGCNVTILCWDRDCNEKLPEIEFIKGVQIIRYRIPSKYGTRWKQIGSYFLFLIECRHYYRDHKVDFLHCHDIDGAIIGAVINHNSKLIFDMHEIYERGSLFSRFFWRKVTIMLLRMSHAGLYVTSFYLNAPYKSVRTKLYELRNYPDSSLITRLPKIKSDVFRIGYHGVVRNQIQEFRALFDAVANLPNVRVDVNGGGIDLPDLLKLVKHYNNVYIHGPYDGIIESSNMYASTDLLFLAYPPEDPNYQGDVEVIKFYEAIFTGTPILVTKGIGMEQKVVENGFGLACDTRNTEDIRKSILYFLNNKDFWQSCHENEIRYSSKYLWDKAVKVLDLIYNL